MNLSYLPCLPFHLSSTYAHSARLPKDVDGHVEAAGAEQRLHHPVQPLPVHHLALHREWLAVDGSIGYLVGGLEEGSEDGGSSPPKDETHQPTPACPDTTPHPTHPTWPRWLYQ